MASRSTPWSSASSTRMLMVAVGPPVTIRGSHPERLRATCLIFQQAAQVVREALGDAVVPHQQSQSSLSVENIALRAVVDRIGAAHLPGMQLKKNAKFLCRALGS